jgi:hypothetical protein
MRIRKYRGTRFEIWNGGHSWFWFVGNARCNGAAIGAAANEAEAISEACSSIEEKAARSSSAEVTPGSSDSWTWKWQILRDQLGIADCRELMVILKPEE